MTKNSVCAVVVTYHPSIRDIDNLMEVRPQVETIVVVDNGSSTESISRLRSTGQALNVVLIENGANLGIATALNIGIRYAIAQRHEWVILFDQDSRVTDGFVQGMLDDFASCGGARHIMQIIPRYQDPVTGDEEITALHKDGGPFITRTSGSLFPSRVFQQCGYFKEELFIYCVDDEYSLRLRSLGFSITKSRSAVLLHSAGSPSRVRFLGRTFVARNYRPEIQYYWARNRVWLMRQYGLHYPGVVLYSSFRSLLGVPLKIMVGEKDRLSKLWFFYKGVLDGLIGRMGFRVSLD